MKQFSFSLQQGSRGQPNIWGLEMMVCKTTAAHIWSSDLAKLLVLSITKKKKRKTKWKNNETPQNKLKEYFCYLIRRIKVRKYKKNGTCNFNSAYQMQNKGSYFSHQIASGLAVEFLNLHLTTSLYLPASLSLAAPIPQQSGACARLMPICSASFAGLANLTHLAFRMDAFTRLKKSYICSKIYYCKNIL